MYVLTMIGALLAYTMGTSFSTGQEFMQFYAVHGYYGAIGMFLQTFIMIAFCIVIFWDCRKYNFKNPKDCLIAYCGKYLGTAVYFYTVIYMYCMLLQLIAGAGSIIMEYFQVPYAVGACLIAALSIGSVLLGMQKIISLISKVAPFKVLLVMIVAIVGLIYAADGIVGGTAIARSADVLRVSDSWFLSFILHNSYAVLFFLPFLVSIAVDKSVSRKELTLIATIGQSVLTIIAIIMILAMVANFSLTGNTQAPNLVMATTYLPFIAGIFTIILFASIFTTISPIAIMVAQAFAKPRTLAYNFAGSASILFALGLSFFASFSQILNIFVSVSGWIGLGVYACIIFTKLFRKPKPIEDTYDSASSL
ncbi:hypothetical protein P4V54_22440 [Brevibacillus nitrificans]|uniref:hypothetical protein n=1 Tax=Brevibacillus nitrificans TaxID=651560 RepID=UPI002E1CC1B7|nr:hypothetical protein [Brevibacillus nitrificans]